WSRGAAAELDDGLRGPLDGGGCVGEVHAALEAKTCVCREAQASCFALDHRGVPERAFEKNVASAVADAAMLAAHDAGEPQRLRLVGDEQEVGIEIERLAVE